MLKKIEVKCPNCEKKFSYYDGTFRPFCSERCKMADLGNWFEESYKVPGLNNSVYIDDQNLFGLESDENDNEI